MDPRVREDDVFFNVVVVLWGPNPGGRMPHSVQ
jgi:hypothetical protein